MHTENDHSFLSIFTYNILVYDQIFKIYWKHLLFCICNALKMFNIIQYCHLIDQYGVAPANDKYCSYKIIIFLPNKSSKS